MLNHLSAFLVMLFSCPVKLTCFHNFEASVFNKQDEKLTDKLNGSGGGSIFHLIPVCRL